MSSARQRYIGLMSGTSMDGVDAGLLMINGQDFHLERGMTRRIPRPLHGRLIALVANARQISLDEYGELDTALGQFFAEVALELVAAAELAPGDIVAIGSHGQTVRHGAAAAAPFTLQIGNPSVIAARTGIDTISDFRSRDIALGGQGAPLAPGFHQAAFATPGEDRVVINLGGISNITILHRDGSVTGHDTGPGNVLLDAWCHQQRGQDYDDAGAWARSGETDDTLLQALLQEPFFACLPPKSTGRELFNLSWLTNALLAQDRHIAPRNVQATLCELTARSLASAIQRFAPGARRCLVCGGGAHNDYLVERLGELLDDCLLEPTDRYGLAADYVEAAAFGWLAWRFKQRLAGNIPAVTGASAAAVLGSITPA